MLRVVSISSSALLVLASLYGCATPAAQSGDVKEARDQPVYRTGSNLPVKDPSQKSDVGSMSGEDFKNQATPALIHPQMPGSGGRSP